MRSALTAVIGAGAVALTACSGLPEPYNEADAPRFRPLAKVPALALVLGGGGPRGFAHIGVLKALEAAGVKPDIVVGSSAGALVGALWASGLSAAAIEKLALELETTQLLSLRDLALSRWGWFRGIVLSNTVNMHVQQQKLENFPLRFVAVATEIPSGSIAMFNVGNAGLAVRASSAIPGQITPVRIADKTFVDGDLISPVPIRVARTLGAQRVIAVDVSADLLQTPALEKTPVDWITTGVTRKVMIENERPLADVFITVTLPYYAGGSRAYREATIAAGELAGQGMIAAHRVALGLK